MFVVLYVLMYSSGRMAGVNGDRKGKKDDNGIGTAIDFMLSNAKLVLGVGGAAMLGIATLAVKRVRIAFCCLSLTHFHWPHQNPGPELTGMTCARVFPFTDVRPRYKRSHQPHQDGAVGEEKLGGAGLDGLLAASSEQRHEVHSQQVPAVAAHLVSRFWARCGKHSGVGTPSTSHRWSVRLVAKLVDAFLFWQTPCLEESCSSSTVGADTVVLDYIVMLLKQSCQLAL